MQVRPQQETPERIAHPRPIGGSGSGSHTVTRTNWGGPSSRIATHRLDVTHDSDRMPTGVVTVLNRVPSHRTELGRDTISSPGPPPGLSSAREPAIMQPSTAQQ